MRNAESHLPCSFRTDSLFLPPYFHSGLLLFANSRRTSYVPISHLRLISRQTTEKSESIAKMRDACPHSVNWSALQKMPESFSTQGNEHWRPISQNRLGTQDSLEARNCSVNSKSIEKVTEIAQKLRRNAEKSEDIPENRQNLQNSNFSERRWRFATLSRRMLVRF